MSSPPACPASISTTLAALVTSKPACHDEPKIDGPLHAATHLGKRAEAAQLQHAGLKVSASSVWSLNQRKTPTQAKRTPAPAPKSSEPAPEPAPTPKAPQKPPQRVTAKRANHVWHVDSTVITVRHTPIANIIAPARWPMTWHVVVVVDHFTRAFVGFGVFKKAPTGARVVRVLKHAAVDAGTAPRAHHQRPRAPFMSSDYDEWCTQNKVRQRYGAIGQHGSIAVVERFIKTATTPAPSNRHAARGSLSDDLDKQPSAT
jgi:transposase InsO family protein